MKVHVIMSNDFPAAVCTDATLDAKLKELKLHSHNVWRSEGKHRSSEPYKESGRRFIRAYPFEVDQ